MNPISKPKLTLKRKKVMSFLFPLKYLKFSAIALGILLISPFLLISVEPEIIKDKKLFHAIIATFSCLFTIESILLGIVLFHTKIPFMQEWKDKLGYQE